MELVKLESEFLDYLEKKKDINNLPLLNILNKKKINYGYNVFRI